jgi:hypothetical protein
MDSTHTAQLLSIKSASNRNSSGPNIRTLDETDISRILDTAYRIGIDTKRDGVTPTQPSCPVQPIKDIRQIICPNRVKAVSFIFGYIKALVRYVKHTTATHYMADERRPNVSPQMIDYIGKTIDRISRYPVSEIGQKQYMKLRIYKKLLTPLVIAVRHRDELIRLRVAHNKVRGDYNEITQKLDKRTNLGVTFTVPEINRDILLYVERYGMPEEFIFEPELMADIRAELGIAPEPTR